ncbi:MAG: methyl-accepting chemotaxis protein [Paracoccaceae bacterium]
MVLGTVLFSLATLAVLLTLSTRKAIEDSMAERLEVGVGVFSFDLNTTYGSTGLVREHDETGEVTSVIWDAIPDFTSNDIAIGSKMQTFTEVSLLRLTAFGTGLARVTTTIPAGDGTPAVNSTLALDLAEPLLRGEHVLSFEMVDGVRYWSHFMPVNDPNGQVIGALEAALPTTELTAVMLEKVWISLGTTLVLIAAAFGMVALVTPRILRPLDEIGVAMQDIAQGDYGRAVPHTDLPDAVGSIAGHLESLAGDLATARAERRQREQARAEDDARAEAAAATQKRVVDDISDGLKRLAAGDLTRLIESPPDNPFPVAYDGLRTSYNQVVENLGRMVHDLGDVATSVRSGASEIEQAAEDLSARAETQAATLEQSAAALNQLTESVHSTSELANKAEDAGGESRGKAESGAEIVRAAIDAMHKIEKSSENVNRIIGVIDDIAFQTNLLALNAGVEAARAGEAGKGFAVVASEVRGLAQRASESAREIKSLISQSSAQVAEGSELVSATGERLEEILAHTIELQGFVSDIAAAAREQASGLSEINAGVTQLDTVTQQNAAVAEETNAASTSLSVKSEELVGTLTRFRTAGQPQPAPRPEIRAGNRPRPVSVAGSWLDPLKAETAAAAPQKPSAEPDEAPGFKAAANDFEGF